MIKEINFEQVNDVTCLESDLFSAPWSSSQLDSHLSSKNKIWGFWRENDLLGYLIVSQVADEWEIYRIAVVEQARRQGIAHDLIMHFQKLCNINDRVFLEVNEVNHSAQRFYAEEGFAEVGRRKGYYADGNDAILMMKNVI